MPQNNRTMLDRKAAQMVSIEAGLADRPEFIRTAKEALISYAVGQPVDFSRIPIAIPDVGPMREAIYATLRSVGYGETLTYGQLAERSGYPGMAREIGEAMGKNPIPIIIPCHRVLAAGRKIGGFSAPGGAKTKERLLALEGVHLGIETSSQMSLGI